MHLRSSEHGWACGVQVALMAQLLEPLMLRRQRSQASILPGISPAKTFPKDLSAETLALALAIPGCCCHCQ